ncbi:alpha/beta-Hydrolases superfamily protein [Actinidia rufa]|uniref:Alpha/beta-Hydrolases superfamily protein n=1 Tax=Actinidia rufa TaxID=165716 RepID=A0A7J0H4V2_9ERIC|nr:alpha/beta-Hydrolases superfamily protein [Actinidia rufa]
MNSFSVLTLSQKFKLAVDYLSPQYVPDTGCLLCLYCQGSMVAKGNGFDDHVGMWIQVKGNHFVEERVEELQIYFLFFDQAGYGERDPNPKPSVKREAFDIQELADKLPIGSRLSGASFVVPFVHYGWPCVPPDLSKAGFKRLAGQDQWTFQVAHYAPYLKSGSHLKVQWRGSWPFSALGI